ncbi:MAG: right-handed parallel beta-helix repeat-containing protein [Paenibacillus sp.]|nr:right-handed parallel beta-helix repeat-containing protein [Paenibacillus sp.]
MGMVQNQPRENGKSIVSKVEISPISGKMMIPLSCSYGIGRSHRAARYAWGGLFALLEQLIAHSTVAPRGGGVRFYRMRGVYRMMTSIEYYVSPDGGDEQPGSLEAPFRTIGRAQRAARIAAEGGMAGEITVICRAGTYEVSRTLIFDERDSGRDGYRVQYRGAPGERVVWSGGQRVTGWERYNESIWRAHLPNVSNVCTLYSEHGRIPEARYPVSGYLHTDEADHADAPSATKGFHASNHEWPPVLKAEGLKVYIWPGSGEANWFAETLPVRSWDAASGWVQLDQPATWGLGGGSRYYLQGSLELLQPGQFYWDPAVAKLYYWPSSAPQAQNETPETAILVVPHLQRLLQVSGSHAECPVNALSFEDLIFAHSGAFPLYRMPLGNAEREEHREGLVYVNYADGVEFHNCQIRHSGTSGFFLDRHASHISIVQCRIEHNGYTGINVSGFAPGEGDFMDTAAAYTNKHHVISDNLIAHCGELIGHGSGITLYQSGHNEVLYNRIRCTPRYGISLKGLRHGVIPATVYGSPVTWENHWDALFTRNNRIVGNDISEVMEDSQDGGLIEAWGTGRGNLISGNRLHHSGIRFSYGFGIYLDDAADDFTVTGNLIDHLYSEAKGTLWMLIFSKGIGNCIRNNLLVDNPLAVAAIGMQEMAGEANRHVTVEHNMVLDSGALYYFVNWSPDRLTMADHNLYWRSGQPCLVLGKLPLQPLGADGLGRFSYSWTQWRTLADGAFDANTRIADPRLKLDEEGYRLETPSSALNLGWSTLPRSFGPRKFRSLD